MNSFITAEQFNRLQEAQQYDLLEKQGTYLQVYQRVGPVKMALFALYSFYVEVHLHQVHDTLLKATAFSDYKKLDPYVKELDITDIYVLL